MSVHIKPMSPSLPGITFGLDGFETPAGGIGGWETLDRPRRAAAAGWVGLPAKTLTIPLMLNGMEAGGTGVDRAVESQITTVTSWGQPHRKTKQPPILRVTGLPTVKSKERWVVQDIAWGEYITSSGGRRIQQPLVLTLLQYVPPAIVKGPAAKARERQHHKPKKGKGK